MGNKQKHQIAKPVEQAPQIMAIVIEQDKEQNNEPEYSNQIIVKDEQLFRINAERLKDKLHRSVGAITFLNKNKKMGYGSGVLISKDLILTAAHNIYDKDYKCEYTRFRFYLGADGETDKFYEVKEWRYDFFFKYCLKSAKMEYDYAIMKLKDPIQFDEYLPLAFPCQKCFDNSKQLNVYGFPLEYGNYTALDQKGNKMKLHQYGLTRSDRMVTIDPSRFKIGYGISTLPGQSGCPVVLEDAIIAIHVGGDKQQFNVGRIIDSSLIKMLFKWRQEVSAAPFRIKGQTSACQHSKMAVRKIKNQTTKLNLRKCDLDSADLSDFINLVELNLSSNFLKQITLGYLPHLNQLALSINRLEQIDISHCPNLAQLDIFSNRLHFIDLNSNIHLTRLNLDSNNLQKIDLRVNTDLKYLIFGFNKISEIDLSKNTKLIELLLHNNQIVSIDLSKNTQLIRLNLRQNNLSSICLSNNHNLLNINLQDNNIQKIELRHNTKLQLLKLGNNKLTHICLTILENISLNQYIGKSYGDSYDFSFVNQQTSTCQIQVACETETVREKATSVVNQWRKIYDGKWKINCVYSFTVI